jgi:hypothetical protein
MSKKFYNGIDVTNNRIINLASPSTATDATNKQYVDNMVNGLDWKESVQAATTTTGVLSAAYSAGQVIDGYTLVSGDRLLVKNQTTSSENGLYLVQSTGAPVRSGDASQGNLTTNATTRVNNGTVNIDTAWTLVTIGSITVGTTAQSWVRSDSGTPYTAGNGLSLASNTFAVVPGLGIQADGSTTHIDTGVVVRKYSQDIGDGTTTAIVVTHSLGVTTGVQVQLIDNTTKAFVDTDVAYTSSNTVTLTFATAPATGAFKVVIFG